MKKEATSPRDYTAIKSAKKAIGSWGVAINNFYAPKSLAIEEVSENIYIADALNGRIQVFDKELNHSFLFTKTTSPHNKSINYPWGVSINGLLVFVTEKDGNRMKIFHLDGYFITVLQNSEMQPDTNLQTPKGIAVDRDNTTYLCDSGHKRVLVLLPVLPLVDQIKFESSPIDVKLHKEHLLVLEENTIKVTFLTKTGKSLRILELDMESPEFLAVDPFDNLLIAIGDTKYSVGNRYGCIAVISWEGKLIHEINNLFKNIKGLAIDKDGSIINVCELEGMRLKRL